jgi:hypothetical protein
MVGDEKIEFNFNDAMFIPSHAMTKLISMCTKFLILIVRMD